MARAQGSREAKYTSGERALLSGSSIAASETRRLQVEIVFDMPQHLIVDATLISEAQHGSALHIQQLAVQRSITALVQRAGILLGIRIDRQQHVAMVLGHVVIQGRVLRAIPGPFLFEMIERCVERNPTSISLFAADANSAFDAKEAGLMARVSTSERRS